MGTQRDQLRLWLVAFLASVLINVVILLSMVGMEALSWLTKARNSFQEAVDAHRAAQQAQAELVLQAVIQPGSTPAAAVTRPPQNQPSKNFARTSPNQENITPDPTNLIGERDTKATSEVTPDPAAQPLPSQKGVKPRLPDEIETTESQYQKGDLAHDHIAHTAKAAETTPPPPAQPTQQNQFADPTVARPSQPRSAAPPRSPSSLPSPPKQATPAREVAKLAQSPFPVDTPVKPTKASEGTAKEPSPQEKPDKTEAVQESTRPDEKDQVKQTPPEPDRPFTPSLPPPRPATAGSPGFRGNQHRTSISGSISRRGISAENVKSSPLGRYYALLSRAIEQEWQLNCERNRDFIVPGILRVRFVIGTDAKVRSVEFLEPGVGGSAIQKGFTLKSIREASIPRFPTELKQELHGDELEVSYSFIF